MNCVSVCTPLPPDAKLLSIHLARYKPLHTDSCDLSIRNGVRSVHRTVALRPFSVHRRHYVIQQIRCGSFLKTTRHSLALLAFTNKYSSTLVLGQQGKALFSNTH